METYTNAPDQKDFFLRAIRLLDEATARDPGFVLAYCYAARAHDLLYFLDLDPMPARAVRGQVAAETALRLAPNSAEAHLTMADYYFRCQRDYASRREGTRFRSTVAAKQHPVPHSFRLSPSAGRDDGKRGSRISFGQSSLIRAISTRAICLPILMFCCGNSTKESKWRIARSPPGSIFPSLDCAAIHPFRCERRSGNPASGSRCRARRHRCRRRRNADSNFLSLSSTTMRHRRHERWRRRRAILFRKSILASIIRAPGMRRSLPAPLGRRRKLAALSPPPERFWNVA